MGQGGRVSVASVVLCAPAPGNGEPPWADALAAALVVAGVPVTRPVVPPDDGPSEPAPARAAHWVAHTAIGVGVTGVPAPVMLVTVGAASLLLPALAFAQRAARRPVGHYVLVGGPAPVPGGGADWPEAPVTYVVPADPDEITREAALTARLRGWDVVADVDPASAVLRLVGAGG